MVVKVLVVGSVGAASVADLGSGESITAEGQVLKSNASDAAFEGRTTLGHTDTENATRSFELVVEDETGSSALTPCSPRDSLTVGQYNYTLGEDSGPLATGTVPLDRAAVVVSDARAESVVDGEVGTVAATVRNRGDFRGL